MKSIVSSLLSVSFDLEGNDLVALDSSSDDNNVWTLDGAILYPVGRFPVRMTIIRLNGPTTTTTSAAEGEKKSNKLLVWSPFPPPPESSPVARAKFMQQIERLGTVAYIVAPNSLHWMGVMPFAQACSNTSEIQVCVAPGLATKQEAIDAGLQWDFVLSSNEIPPEWKDNNEIQVKYIPGIPQLEEVILYHTASKTLLIGDMAFHFQRQHSDNPKFAAGGFLLPLYLYAMDGYRPCCLTRTFKWLISDIDACCRAMEEVVAEYDFECIVMAHGAIVSRNDAKQILTQGTVSLLQEWRDAAAKRKQQKGKMTWPVAVAALVAISSIGAAMTLWSTKTVGAL
jgi:Domain of unknown function (DUF4336)